MMRIRLVSVGFLCTLLLVSCGKQTVRRDVTIGNEVLQVSMPVGKKVVHPVHGKELWFAVGPLKGEGKTNANGVAQSHVFADGTTVATVNLNIQPAPKGFRFVAWLRKPGALERVRLDTMMNPLHDVRHLVTVEVAKDLRAYTDVLVTLERTSGPDESDPVQATGVLKVQKR